MMAASVWGEGQPSGYGKDITVTETTVKTKGIFLVKIYLNNPILEEMVNILMRGGPAQA
jgi:hypothetical protein